MAALQVHHHRRAPQYPPQQVTFGLDERRAGYCLRQEITVLTEVLLGCGLPGHPVRLRLGIHNGRLLPAPPRVKRLSSPGLSSLANQHWDASRVSPVKVALTSMVDGGYPMAGSPDASKSD